MSESEIISLTDIDQLSKDTRDDIARDLKRINSYNGGAEIRGFKLSDKHRIEILKTERVLKRLRSDLNTSIARHQKRGKIDISSYVKARQQHTTKFFKQHILNEIDKSRMAVSLIVDCSGSVNHQQFTTEISAAYCLTRALENLKNDVEVIQFSDGIQICKTFGKKGDYRRTFSGNTYLSKPLLTALEHLKKADAPNKIIIVMTDGAFNDANAVRDSLKTIRKAGVITVWILCSGRNAWYYNDAKNQKMLNFGFDHYLCVPSFDLLSTNLNKIIDKIQRRINENIRRGV